MSERGIDQIGRERDGERKQTQLGIRLSLTLMEGNRNRHVRSGRSECWSRASSVPWVKVPRSTLEHQRQERSRACWVCSLLALRGLNNIAYFLLLCAHPFHLTWRWKGFVEAGSWGWINVGTTNACRCKPDVRACLTHLNTAIIYIIPQRKNNYAK